VTAPDYPGLLADVAAEEGALDAVLADLDPAAWATPTPAAGWDVRDSVAHLAFTEDLAMVALTDPDGFSVRRDALLAAEDDALLLGDGRRRSGAAVRDRWRAASAATLDRLAALGPRDRVLWFTGPISAMSFATARLMETWAHGQDVRDALGLDPAVSARLRHVADLGVRTRPFAYETRGRIPNPAPVRVELTGPDGARWVWGDPADDHVRGAALDFCLVVTQRINPADTDLTVEGPAAAEWIGIAQAFAGSPTEQRPPRPG